MSANVLFPTRKSSADLLIKSEFIPCRVSEQEPREQWNHIQIEMNKLCLTVQSTKWKSIGPTEQRHGLTIFIVNLLLTATTCYACDTCGFSDNTNLIHIIMYQSHSPSYTLIPNTRATRIIYILYTEDQPSLQSAHFTSRSPSAVKLEKDAAGEISTLYTKMSSILSLL